MDSEPFIAIGNDELGDPVGDTIRCDKCGGEHPLEYGTSRTLQDDGTWSEPKPSRLIGFYKCGGDTYLGSLNGRSVCLTPKP